MNIPYSSLIYKIVLLSRVFILFYFIYWESEQLFFLNKRKDKDITKQKEEHKEHKEDQTKTP